MFTGLIETTGVLVELANRGERRVLSLTAAFQAGAVAIGDSIAVNGICLTVIAQQGDRFQFDVSPETVKCSGLATLRPGARLNLERALSFGGRLDGHLVTGHVDCTATLAEQSSQGNAVSIRFKLPAEHAAMLVPKGSVAIDGISLTVNDVGSDWFTVAIIPHTLARTTLQLATVGTLVNIETDIIGKYVARLVSPHRTSGGLTFEKLASHGFM